MWTKRWCSSVGRLGEDWPLLKLVEEKSLENPRFHQTRCSFVLHGERADLCPFVLLRSQIPLDVQWLLAPALP